jgi:RNA polymerase I-specific transcription initiation factor RRN6
VLHSRLNNLIQVYVFSEYPSGSPTIISTSDPSVLNLTVDGSSRITDIRMVPMQYSDVREEAYQPGPGRTYVESGIEFFRLFVTRADLSVHELVVYTKRPDEVESTHDDRIVENFTQSIIRHPRRGASKTHAIDEDEDFILLDGLTTVEALRSKTVSQVPNWCRAYERTSLHDARNHRPMLKALLRDGQGSSNSVDVSVVINQVRQILEDDPDLSLPPRSTL